MLVRFLIICSILLWVNWPTMEFHFFHLLALNGSGLNGDPPRPTSIKGGFGDELIGIRTGMDFLKYNLRWFGFGF